MSLNDRLDEIFGPDTDTGEKGELGEKPRGAWDSYGRTRGEWGRKKGEFDAAEAKQRARSRLAAKAFVPPDYPVDALGDVLGEAAKTISTEGQLSVAMGGQVMLGAAALCAQGHANVQTMAGTAPLSLNLLTVNLSGDGKSTAERAALKPIKDYERDAATLYKADLDAHDELDTDAPPPAPPWVLMRDATIEGIRSSFLHGRSSQGLFTAEAAALLGGYGMAKDQRQKTAAGLNGLWDDGEVSAARVTTGRIQLYGRRLSLHWLIQPDCIREMFADPVMTSMGFWPRFLLAWPEPYPPRTAKPFEPSDHHAIRRAWGVLSSLVAVEPPEDCSDLPVIGFDGEARDRVLYPAFERFEHAAKVEDGIYTGVRPFALRATEQLCRVAGVLAVADGKQTIDADTSIRALKLVLYSIETWRTLAGDREESESHAAALCLFDWIADHDGESSETAILRRGPKRHSLRSAAMRDTALSVLDLAGLIAKRGNVWRIT